MGLQPAGRFLRRVLYQLQQRMWLPAWHGVGDFLRIAHRGAVTPSMRVARDVALHLHSVLGVPAWKSMMTVTHRSFHTLCSLLKAAKQLMQSVAQQLQEYLWRPLQAA